MVASAALSPPSLNLFSLTAIALLACRHLGILIDERNLNILGTYHLYEAPLQASNYWKLVQNSDIGSAIDLFGSVKALIESQKFYFSFQGIKSVPPHFLSLSLSSAEPVLLLPQHSVHGSSLPANHVF